MKLTILRTFKYRLYSVILSSSIKVIALSFFFFQGTILLAQLQVEEIYNEVDMIKKTSPSEGNVERLFYLTKILIDSAAYDQLLNIYELAYDKAKAIDYKTGEDQALLYIANEYFLTGSYQRASQYSDSLLIRNTPSDSLQKVALYIKGTSLSVTGEYNEAITALKKALDISVELSDEMELYDYLSYSYSGIGNYEQAISTCFAALDILEQKYPTGYRHFSQFHHNLGLIYFQNEEYEEALKNYQEGLAYNLEYEAKGKPEATIQSVTKFAISKRIPILLETGSVYKNLKLPDSAITFFKRAKKIALSAGPRNREIRLSAIGIALANIYNELGQFNTSLEELELIEPYFTSGKLENYTEYVSFLISKGVAYEGLGQYDNALLVLTDGITKAEQLAIEDVSTITDLYRALAAVHESLNNFEEALNYFQAVTVHEDSIFNKEKTRIVKELETRYETLEKEKQLIESNAREEKLSNQLILATIGATLFLILSVSLYWLSKRKQQANQLLEQKNEALESSQLEVKRLMQRETELLQTELENKERELAVLAINANEMDQFLHSFKKDLDALDSKEIRQLSKQIDNQIAAENSWQKFLKHFENVHPEFFSRLKSDFPKLTNHDLKLSAYIRIGMDNKEIANMTGIDHNSARNSVYRLKKKLDLSHEQSIRDFIFNY